MNRLNEAVITLVNLKDGSVEKTMATKDMDDFLGGAALNAFFLGKYRDRMPLVLGTGPLTAGFAPASCLLTASFFKPGFGPCHVPVVVRSGPMLKFSGTDVLILLDQAPDPVLVSIKKGRVELIPDPFDKGLDIFKIVNACRSGHYGEPVLVTGPGVDPGDTAHGACTSVFGGFDGCGLAGFMAAKNIRAILPGGGRGLAFSKDDFEACNRVTRKIKKGLPRKRFLTVLNALSSGKQARSLVKKQFKQSHACFHCPVGGITYLKIEQGRRWLGEEAPQGVFVMDYDGFSALARKRPGHAHLFMARAQSLGISPLALAASIPDEKPSEMILAGMNERPLSSPVPESDASAQWDIRPEAYLRFGNALPRTRIAETETLFGSWEERVAFAMISGICPIPLLVIPGLSPLDYLPFLTRDTEDPDRLIGLLEQHIQRIGQGQCI